MKLITHNMLTSKCVKGVTKGYPLVIDADNTQTVQVEFNPEFMARMIPKINWDVLWEAAHGIGFSAGLPKTVPEDYESNEDFLKKAHYALMEVEVTEGRLLCPESGRKFPITRGIPNMLLTEAEV